jgi:hypothetical protein
MKILQGVLELVHAYKLELSEHDRRSKGLKMHLKKRHMNEK